MNFSAIKTRMSLIENEVDGLWSEHADLERELQAVCPHANTEINRGYNAPVGMADDRARAGFHEIKSCNDCGKYIAERYERSAGMQMGEWHEI